MASTSHIEWTDATWNILTGCKVLSPGCKNCYAMKLAGGRLRHDPSRAGLTTPMKNGPVWNGQVRFNRTWLDQPLRWKRRRRIFVCAHGDLFYESVPDEWIDDVFAVMGLNYVMRDQPHEFQVLTKRAERMQQYLTDPETVDRVTGKMKAHGLNLPGENSPPRWPLPNVQVGVSIENKAALDARLGPLRHTPAASRFLSVEPLLEMLPKMDLTRIDWVIVGGESGPGARPMHPAWATAVLYQCTEANVPFFFKQWGDWLPERLDIEAENHPIFDKMPENWRDLPDKYRCLGVSGKSVDGYGGDPDHKFREVFCVRVGKRRAGRLLEGDTYDETPPPGPWEIWPETMERRTA